MRAERLRANGGFLRPEAFQARKEFLVAKDTGALHEQVRVYVLKCVTRNVLCAGPAQQHEPHQHRFTYRPTVIATHNITQNLPGAVNPMANPGGMMEMVKGQAYFGMTQMGMVQVGPSSFCYIIMLPPRYAMPTMYEPVIEHPSSYCL